MSKAGVFINGVIRFLNPRGGGETALVFRSRLQYRIGKWHVYKARLRSKEVTLILPHAVKSPLTDLKRITDHMFIGGHK